MIFGFNTDVEGKDAVYHVQTEDRGEKNPVIDSIIYIKGKIVDRRRTPYVPAEVTTTHVEEMVRQQHRALVEEIRSGTFAPSGTPLPQSEPPATGYDVRLQNPAELVRGPNLQFEFSLAHRGQAPPEADVSLEARWVLDGMPAGTDAVQAELDGSAIVSFPIPEEQTEAVLVVCVQGSLGKQFAKYRVGATRA